MGFSLLLKKASLAGAFFVSAIWLSSAQAFCPAPSGLTSVAVQRVVDGDTLRLSDGRSVRMIGLNTPELGRQGRTDEPFAVAARKRLEALVAASNDQVGLLPAEALLCEEYAVSRPVLREATRVLVAKGLVYSRPRVGTVVKARDRKSVV